MARALLQMKSTSLNLMACATENKNDNIRVPNRNAKVLILGGTGRVGGSTAIALSKLCPELRIVVGGRNREKGAAMVDKLGKNCHFAEVNIDSDISLRAALSGVDLVVHAAGPFQQSRKCSVLEAAIKTKTAYIDVCDDTSYAIRAKSFKDRALAANVPALTTAGIYPGISNVMAAELVRAARTKSKGKPDRLRFYYYTEGTGGAGPAILASTFLLLGEEVVVYNKGKKIKLKAFSEMLNVDFGKGIGKKDVYLLNLPEVQSAYDVLGIPTVSARFATAPFFWNWGMEVVTNLLPPEFLRDRSKIQGFVQLFDPIIRAVDVIAGEHVSMRVDLGCTDGCNTVAIFTHRRLSECVGNTTAAFVLAILEGSTQPGVWFPEEPEGIAIDAREVLLQRAAKGTINFFINKLRSRVETDHKELGLGIRT